MNGQAVSSDAPAETPLLWVIREQLKLTGTKFGCRPACVGRAWSTLTANVHSLVRLRFPKSPAEP
jgi:aerobic-type carbon monoxide dehydrogenase small subunit (CoxS/CutS family)